jgi:hypothetical protein
MKHINVIIIFMAVFILFLSGGLLSRIPAGMLPFQPKCREYFAGNLG